MDPSESEAEIVALYNNHARQLYHYLARRVGTEVAHDLVADAFLVAWEQRAGFDPVRASSKAWLYGIATNLVRHHLRGEERRLRAWARAFARRRNADDVGDRIATIVDAEVQAGRAAEA